MDHSRAIEAINTQIEKKHNLLQIIKSNLANASNLVEAGDLELDKQYTENYIKELRASRSLLE